MMKESGIRKSHVFRATSSLHENVWQAIILEFREKKYEKTPSKIEKPKMTEQIISLNRFRSICEKLPFSFPYRYFSSSFYFP